MFDFMLTMAIAAAMKTPTKKDEEALRKLQAFIKQHPPLLEQFSQIIQLLFTGKGKSDEFKTLIVDFVFGLLNAKGTDAQIDREQ